MIMSLKQKKRKIKPRIKLNHNIYADLDTSSHFKIHLYLESFWFCWFSRDVIKIQTRELLILPSFYFHEALEQLSKTNTQTNFHFFLRNRALDLCGRIFISEQSLHQKEYYYSNV